MRILGLLLSCLVVLSACGEETAGPDDDRAGHEQTSPSTPDTPARPEVAAIVHATGGGGDTSLPPMQIDDGGLPDFLATLEGESLPAQVTAVAKEHGDDPRRLYAQVVTIGCDVPKSVEAVVDDSMLLLTPAKPASPMRECFAPVTTVAIVAVDQASFQE